MIGNSFLASFISFVREGFIRCLRFVRFRRFLNKTNMCSSAQEHISLLVGWEWSSGAPGGEGASGVWGPLLEAFFGSFLCGDKKERSRENPSWKKERSTQQANEDR